MLQGRSSTHVRGEAVLACWCTTELSNVSMLRCRAGARRTLGARQGSAQERGPLRAPCHATKSRFTTISQTRSWKSRFPRTGARQAVIAVSLARATLTRAVDDWG